MKAIFTKYHGPTNTRGSRIFASDGDGNKAILSYPHELSTDDAHAKAAEKLQLKMGWSGKLLGPSWYGNIGVFVFAPEPAWPVTPEPPDNGAHSEWVSAWPRK